jgi:hypothetical protein
MGNAWHPILAQYWYCLGTTMAPLTESISGPWHNHGMALALQWHNHGKCLAQPWEMLGIQYKPTMVLPWHNHGTFNKTNGGRWHNHGMALALPWEMLGIHYRPNVSASALFYN